MSSPDSESESAAAAAAARALAACEFPGWGERETWALEDSVPKFSLEDGQVTLWRRMSLEVPELLTFSPEDLKARWLAMAGESGDAGAQLSLL